MNLPAASSTHVFPLLADPRGYQACPLDLRDQPQLRAYWIGVFRDHFPKLIEEALRTAEAAGQAVGMVHNRLRESQVAFHQWLDRADAEPHGFGRLTILTMCIERERVLRFAGVDDAYRLAKQRENQKALSVLPSLLDQLDAMPDDARAVAVIEGIFAGNIFDMGAVQTADLFRDGASVDFHQVRGRLAKRPWLIDGLDSWLARLRGKPYRRAVLFVDNAGPDIVLGMIPFARDLLRRGTDVLLTANTLASLNDVTIDELHELLVQVATIDPVIREAVGKGRLSCVASGNGYPLIDLANVSLELVEAVQSRAVDLVVIEGMGRAVESNIDAVFTCDALKLAMVKDPGVARVLGGRMYDLVMKFDSPA